MPAAQAAHAADDVAPVADDAVPAAQEVQLDAPAADQEPAAQLTQEPDEREEPAGHVLETVADDVAVDELVGEPEADEVELAVPELVLELEDVLVAAGDAERKALGEGVEDGATEEETAADAEAAALGVGAALGNTVPVSDETSAALRDRL